jgi:hypothetical protein
MSRRRCAATDDIHKPIFPLRSPQEADYNAFALNPCADRIQMLFSESSRKLSISDGPFLVLKVQILGASMRRSKIRNLVFTIAVIISLGIAIPMRTDPEKDAEESLNKTFQGLDGVFVIVSGQEKEMLVAQGITNDWCRQVVELRLRRNGIKILSRNDVQNSPGRPSLVAIVRTGTTNLPQLYNFSISTDLVQQVILDRDPQQKFLTQTWTDSTYGSLGSERIKPSIEDILNDQVDKFSNTYLAENPRSK